MMNMIELKKEIRQIKNSLTEMEEGIRDNLMIDASLQMAYAVQKMERKGVFISLSLNVVAEPGSIGLDIQCRLSFFIRQKLDFRIPTYTFSVAEALPSLQYIEILWRRFEL